MGDKVGDGARLDEVLVKIERFISNGEEPHVGALILTTQATALTVHHA